MGFFAAVSSAFRNYNDFEGRASRREYWFFSLFIVLAFFVAAVLCLSVAEATRRNGDWGAIAFLVMFGGTFLVTLVPHLAVAVRRLHDAGIPGWLILLALVPGIGPILIILFLLPPSSSSNKYGPDPRLDYA